MAKHPKERLAEDFLIHFKGQPTLNDLCSHFKFDYESIIIAMHKAGLTDGEADEVKNNFGGFVHHIAESYKGRPELIRLFANKDLKTALGLYEVNKDCDGIGREIIEYISDDSNYLAQVAESKVFDNDIGITIRNVPYNKQIFGKIEAKLLSLNEVEFDEPKNQEYYIYLELSDYSELDHAQEKKIKEKIQVNAEFKSGDVFLKGKITSTNILFVISEDLLNEHILGKSKTPGVNLKKLKEKLAKGFKGIITDGAIDLIVTKIAENGAGDIEMMSNPKIWAIKTGIKTAIDLLETVTIDPEKEEIIKYFELYKLTEPPTLRDLYLSNIKKAFDSLSSELDLDLSEFPEQVCKQQYRNFLNKYKNKKDILNEDQIEALDKLEKKDKNKYELELFKHVSARYLNCEEFQEDIYLS